MPLLRIGNIELNPNMEVPFINQSLGIIQSNIPTLAGGAIVFQRPVLAGVELQLIATDDQGWVSKYTRDLLLAESLIIGKIHKLQIADTTFNVVFDHSSGAAVELEPFINRLVPLDNDYFKGTIKLITV